METKTFYEREIENKNLVSLVEISRKTTNKEENEIVLSEQEIFDVSVMKAKQNNNLEEFMNPNVLETFLNHLKGGCSFIMAYTYLKNINNIFEKKPGYLGELKKKYNENVNSNIYSLINQSRDSYIKNITGNPDKRILDMGDKVKVNLIEALYNNNHFYSYANDRDKIFPRGSIGTIVNYENYFLKVYFNDKKDYEFDLESFNKFSKNSVKTYLSKSDFEKNIGIYMKGELKFVVPNSIQLHNFETEMNKMRDWLYRSD